MKTKVEEKEQKRNFTNCATYLKGFPVGFSSTKNKASNYTIGVKRKNQQLVVMPTARALSVDGNSVEAMDTEAAPSQSGSNKSAQQSLTPRFSQEEKDILYELFNQHCEVIDIKLRKKQRNKHAVREAWNGIVRAFNANPHISAVRTTKQIQKFWLNARYSNASFKWQQSVIFFSFASDYKRAPVTLL